MAEYNITCESCGGPYLAKRSDAKNCASCRLLKVLTYTAGKFGKKKCRVCKAEYRPASVKDLSHCADCQPDPKAPVVTCVICKKDAPMYERVCVCKHCVKGIASQPVVIRALKKGQAARKAANR